MTKDATLHMIGNAHLDPVWLWRWQEGFQALKATFRSALDRLAETDDFLFTSSSAAFYEWVEQNDPCMFREIAARIAEGRWAIVGGWWIQPDCNIPCGESFIRQGLYGQRYFQEKFGVVARTGFNPDSFGHSGMLPQILLKSGLERYVFLRPGPHEKGLPGRLFWWEADDGSRVLAYRIPYEYNAAGDDVERRVRRCQEELAPPVDLLMCFYGVGNHGGGPTRANIAEICRLDETPGYPRLVFSTPDRYFDAVAARDLPIPVVHDELQHHAPGCYAAHSAVKRWNRESEDLLLAAERWSAVAERVTGQPYPDGLDRAWKDVLFNQFHDILAGTSIEAAYDDARDLYGEARAIAARALNNALQSLSWRVGLAHEDGTTPIVVFNPHAWPVRAAVEADFGRLDVGATLSDDEGRPAPLQLVTPPATVSGNSRTRLRFLADLPPLGYRAYRVVPAAAAAEPAPPPVTAGDGVLEDERYRLELSPATGCPARLYDKRHDVEVFLAAGCSADVLADESDTWAHGVTRFDRVVGRFAARRMTVVEQGPVGATIRVESAYGDSTLVQDFTLSPDLDTIGVRVTVDWHEHHKLLKLRFPVNLDFLRATSAIPYGHIERATTGEEEPGQRWLDLSGEIRGGGPAYGLSLLNDGKYSYDVRGRDIGLTVLRSPIYAHHVPRVPEEDRRFAYLDQGLQSFTYALLPHAGGWEDAGTVRRAAELRQPPVAVVESAHGGPLPLAASFAAVEEVAGAASGAASVVVSAVKRAEDGDDLIVRAHETAGRAATARLALHAWGRTIEATFGPCEIKTFRVPHDPARPVQEVDLLERCADERLVGDTTIPGHVA
ncbi:MAG TPA: glycoside hydrolase family 38 C-terminal domain-containing protein [Thermomicrobiales bacterium]|nr:glycoside hydrolase family 38 C-terminal domain-containing protein [Thermomicrobiales bacterium]